MNTNAVGQAKTKITSIIFLLITIVLIWQIFNIYPEIILAQENIKNEETKVKDLEIILQKIGGLIGFAAENKENIGKFDIILPAVEDKANLLSALDNMASANGLVALKINFNEKAKAGSNQQPSLDSASENADFQTVNVQISLRGSYPSFKNFLTAIENNLRLMDAVSVEFSSDSSKEKEEGNTGVYSYNVELKTYLGNSLKEKNIAELMNNAKFKNFTVESLNFIKEKKFTDLLLSSGYDVNIGNEEIGNEKIF